MTNLRERKSRLRFETCAEIKERGRYRPVVVEADGSGISAIVRLKGTRTAFEIPWDAVYHAAAKLATAKARREKLEAKKRSKHA